MTTNVKETLLIRNPNSEPVAFKVKTTSPKQYSVRPIAGRIEAHGQVTVSVIFQALKEEPAADAKCRDKFQIQSVLISATQETESVSELWQNTERQAKDQIKERKIRCAYGPVVNGLGGAGKPMPPVPSSPQESKSPNTTQESASTVQNTPTSIPSSKADIGLAAAGKSDELQEAQRKISQLETQLQQLNKKKGGFPFFTTFFVLIIAIFIAWLLI